MHYAWHISSMPPRQRVSAPVTKVAPGIAWQRCFWQRTFEHIPVAAWERRALEIPCSAEPELIRAQADYVRTVYGCMRSVGSKEMPNFDEGLFLQAWLCLLTRRFRGPEGSALVPGVDFLNHSWEPNASSDWDEESGAVIVTTTRDLKQGEEVLISYGDFSNPLLFRTYGFTLPSRCETCRSCTFTEEELLATAPKEVAEDLQALPNLHLNSMQVTDELAVLLQVWQGAGDALRQLCQKRLQKLAAEMRWPAEPLEIGETDELRIAFSEYICLRLHANILDELAGSTPEIKDSKAWEDGKELKRELKVIQEAGMLTLT